MNLTLILFIVLAAVAIASAAGLLISRNAVYAALFLVLNFATVAVFFLLLGAPFIALAQVTVYAGAIMVLFLFVIMLLGGEKLPRTNILRWQPPTAIGLAVILFGESGFLLVQRLRLTVNLANPADTTNTVQSMQDFAKMLFGQYLLPFEVTSIILLVAMIGAIVMSKKMKGEEA
jgi:NADH-quinone oxidoreductase subunit J